MPTNALAETLFQFPNALDLIDSIPASLAVLDAGGVILAVNEPWRRFGRENGAASAVSTGVGANCLSACAHTDSDDDGTASAAHAGIAAVLKGEKEFFTLEYPCHSANEHRWFTMNVSKLKGRQGGAVITHTNITARKLAEEASNRNEKDFRRIAESMPQIVWLTRADGWNVYTNQRWVDYTGQSRDDSYGEGWIKPFHPEDHARAREAWAQSVKTLSKLLLECRIRRVDGDYRWWLVQGLPLQDEHGTVLKWLGTCTDIHQMKTAELALRSSEEKFRNLASKAHDGLLVIRSNSTIEVANPQVEAMFGYAPGELLDKKFDSLIAGAHELTAGLEMVGIRKNGSKFPVTVSISPFVTNGELYENCVVRDISVAKELELERDRLLVRERTARQQAEAANRSKDEFLAILSHELGTPLTTILSWAQLLKGGSLDGETAKVGLDILEHSAKTQRNLIDDLMDIARIQAGKLNIDIQEMDPVKVLAAAVDSVRTFAAAKSIQVETSVSPFVGQLLADPMRVQQILWNLLTNAIKFSPPGSKVRVMLNRVSGATGENVRIEVSDNGMGIKPEFLPTIFERFTQADSSSTRSYRGLGLGLAIVRKLVEMHDGAIAVESPGEGRGTTFSVLLPVKPTVPHTPVKPETEVSLEGIRVLLVDDDEDVRMVFSFTLRARGAKVWAVKSAAEALAIFEEVTPDVLVSDIAMPVEDGYHLISQVRALNSRLAKTPALALTAYAGQDDVRRAHEAGFQSHLAKPVDANRLATEISNLAKQY